MPEKFSCEGLKSAADLTKQIVSLSIGVIALTVTFIEKIAQPTANSDRHVPAAMLVAWILYGAAVIAGMATLAAITGSLDAIDRKINGLSISKRRQETVDNLALSNNIKMPAVTMVLTFLSATALTIVSGFVSK